MRLSSAPRSRASIINRFLAGTLCRGPVPELTPGADIKLNPRLPLRDFASWLMFRTGQCTCCRKLLMSDLFLTKQLDGYAATFARFAGPDKFVIEVNGEYRTVTREFWQTLPIYQSQEHRPDCTSTS
jgi:hypothetical protein